MILTSKKLDEYEYLTGHFISIPNDLYAKLLADYGDYTVDSEGHFRKHSEQDVYERVRKCIQKYLK